MVLGSLHVSDDHFLHVSLRAAVPLVVDSLSCIPGLHPIFQLPEVALLAVGLEVARVEVLREGGARSSRREREKGARGNEGGGVVGMVLAGGESGC